MTKEEATAKAWRIQLALLEAIGTRSTLEVAYGFSRWPPSVSDLAAIEKAIERMDLRCSCRPRSQDPEAEEGLFAFDLSGMEQVDDGKDEVRITLDFEKLLGPAPQEEKQAAKEALEALRARVSCPDGHQE